MGLETEQNTEVKVENTDADLKGAPDGDLVTKLEEVKAELKRANDEAARRKAQLDEVIAQRDKLKKAKPVESDKEGSWRELYEQQQEQLRKLEDRDKRSAIENSVREHLLKAKVDQTKLDAAVKLFDRNLVEYDAEAGVNTVTVTAGVSKLKNDFAFLFESTVPKTQLGNPTEQVTDGKTIRRADFEKLSPEAKMTKMVKERYKVID